MERVRGAYSSNRTWDDLLWMLSRLAGEWRESKAERLVVGYGSILTRRWDQYSA